MPGEIKKKSKKPFFEDIVKIVNICKKCGHEETKTYNVKSRKETITPAVPAEVKITTEVELQSTVNDFTDKNGEAPETPPEMPDKSKKEENGVIDKALGK